MSPVPRHLLVWLTGVHGDPPVALDDELRHDGFDLERWLAVFLDGYPDGVAALAFAGSPGSWAAAMAAAADPPSHSRFAGDTTPTSLAGLRAWTGAVLGQRSVACRERAVLVVSGLATNVERFAPGWLTVDLVPVTGGLVVAVTDPRPVSLPSPRDAGPEDPDGRGLAVVASLTDAWGLVVRRTSKTVWTMLATVPTGADAGVPGGAVGARIDAGGTG